MSRRLRAGAFASAAAICAGLAAGATGGGGALPSELGALREVTVATHAVAAGTRLGPRVLQRAFETRRVPARFAPPGALADPALAAGRRTLAALAPGGYLLDSLLREPDAAPSRSPRLARGTSPVEIAVSGAGALAASGARPQVDVVVTTEPGPGGGAGRTYVAAEGVELLDLSVGEGGAGADPLAPELGASVATLALTRAQALRLIHAESFARSVRLIPR
jgi:hypothetical protein